MKTIIAAVGFATLFGCSTHREIQVEMVQAELVKIDTVFRHPHEQKQLTWRGRDNIEYISFVSMEESFVVGINMMVLRTR